jgi:Spy/CpxP family protein refolding chaperone
MISLAVLVLSLALSANSPQSPQAEPSKDLHQHDSMAGHQHAGHPGAPGQARSPYAGAEGNEVKGLSAEEVQAYRDGTGHGMAKPAELNHYPGPRHVLDLAADLGLTEPQKTGIQAIFDRMHARAVSLGERIIERERALDKAFASGELGEAKLQAMVGEIGGLQGELRATHLKAHLETKALLRPEQVSRYDALRGYVSR